MPWFSLLVPSVSLSFSPSSIIFQNLFSHHKINLFHNFHQIEFRGSHTPFFFYFLAISMSLFSFVLQVNIYMGRSKKNKLIFLFSQFPILSLQTTRTKLGTPCPFPRTLHVVSFRFVPNNRHSIRLRCLLSIFIVHFI